MVKTKTLNINTCFLSKMKYIQEIIIIDICVENSFFPDTLGVVVYVHLPKLGFFHCLDAHSGNRCLEACLSCLLFTGRTFQDCDVFLWPSVVLTQQRCQTFRHCSMTLWSPSMLGCMQSYTFTSHRLDMPDCTIFQISFYVTMSRFTSFISETFLGTQDLYV